jgi:hypothetical protein
MEEDIVYTEKLLCPDKSNGHSPTKIGNPASNTTTGIKGVVP